MFNQLGQMFLLQFKQFSLWSDKGENKPQESFFLIKFTGVTVVNKII